MITCIEKVQKIHVHQKSLQLYNLSKQQNCHAESKTNIEMFSEIKSMPEFHPLSSQRKK